MNTTRIFPLIGGIQPPEHKHDSSEAPIRPVPLAERLVLPLALHAGAPAQPLHPGPARVRRGEPIAAAAGPVSAPVHAPAAGLLSGPVEHTLPHPSGLPGPCLILEPDGSDDRVEARPLAPSAFTVDEAMRRIEGAGLAGLGGAGFPTAAKLRGIVDRAQTLILNGAECEPYITADDRTMRERAEAVVAGIDVLLRILEPQRCLIGIEDNKPEAIEAMERALQARDLPVRPRILVVPTRYPSGGERQLIQILTGRQVPRGGLPIDLGMVCVNIGTARAVARAVWDDEPLIDRVTTVTGAAVAHRGNYDVPIGTPFSHLLAHAGADLERADRVLMGGPLMGVAMPSLDVPVVKTTNCLLVPTAEELPPPEPELPCIRCGHCAEVCPASLLPQQLYWFARADDFEGAQAHHLDSCIECGACAWVCPSHIPLVRYYRYAKGEIRNAAMAKAAADRARERYEEHQARIEREAAEKEAKRKARMARRKPAGAPGAKPARAPEGPKAAATDSESGAGAAGRDPESAPAPRTGTGNP